MSRAALPQEYYDKTTDHLLVKPTPQFFYAELYLDALRASLAPPTEMGLPFRSIKGDGLAAYGTPFLQDALKLSSPLVKDVIAATVDFSKGPGNSVRINRPSYQATMYTETSRRIASGASISTVGIKPQSEQTNLTLYRYAGPYDSMNNRVAPFSIEAFDANMGVHKLVELYGNTLIYDFRRFIDAVNVTMLDQVANVIYPQGMTADNDATSAGMFPFTYEQLIRTQRSADDLNLPTGPDGYRYFVGTPTQIAQLGIDPLYLKQAELHPAYNMLFPNYVKSVSKTHIFKSTTLTVKNNSSSVGVHYGHYIAPGVLLAGMGRKPHIEPSTDDNFGETAKVIWLADLAFGLADNTFGLSVRSSSDYTASGGV